MREGVEQKERYPEPWFVSDRWWLRLLYRGLLGRPMDGARWSNATFWRSATSGEDQWWLRLAGWQRATIRVAALWTVVQLPFLTGLVFIGQGQWAWWLAEMQLALILPFLLSLAVYRTLRRHGLALPVPERVTDAEEGVHWRVRMHVLMLGRERWEREKIRPVARTAAALIDRAYHPATASAWVSVPRDYREGGTVEILLPGGFHSTTDAARRRLAHACAERLGIKEPAYRYELEGNAPRLLLTAPVALPELVSMSDLLPALERSAEYEFVLGMSGAEALTVSLKEDSPHLALSAGSGAGKSVLIRLLVMQALHWGWNVLILDWKEESQEWADGLPGVRYIRDIEALHDACVQIGEEVEWRKSHRDQERRKLLVVSEEWGITAPLLTSYWQAYRATLEPMERSQTPLKSPAQEAIMKLNFTGRSLGMCQLLVAQRFSARVTNGNADLRESFATIFMSRWKAQTWKMLAPDIRPVPRKLTKPGQWVAITGDEMVRFQAALVTEEEARQWATSGVRPAASPWAERITVGMRQRPDVETMQRPTLGNQLRSVATSHNSASPELDYIEGEVVTSEHRSVKLMKLRDIADVLDYLAITNQVLRKASRADEQGDPDFPSAKGGNQFSGYLYDVAEVTEWARRKRAREATQARR